MFDDQEIFSFELEETLYFERGQEVSEMVGISLDPNISIHSHNDYVSIKGQIILEGQYEKVEEERIEEESLESDDAEGRRFIDQIEADEDGLSHFFHQFPIEVSIPAYRVVDVEKISVYVDSFDYELKNNNELRVHSLIHIYGIQSHDEPLAPTEEFDTTEQDLSQELEPLDQPSLSFELKEELLEEYMREEEIEEDTKDIEEDRSDAERTLDVDSSEEDLQVLEETEEKEDVTPDEQEVQMNIIERKEKNEEVKETESEEEEREESVERDEPEEETISFIESWFKSRAQEEEGEEGEEATYTQLRICIVQEDDTLDQIAERYNVSKGKIIQQNRLENDRVSEGQLLSIPIK